MTWNDGYVTDVAYAPGYYPQQSPDQMAVCCLLANVLPGFSRRSEQLTYLELGSGRGRGALCLAASNPGWRVIAVDFMPGHIAEARELAEAAKIVNIEFLEADIATLDPATLPVLDVVSTHGLWSWVSPAVKAGMTRLLAERLRPGGCLHVSYNALPAWQKAFGFQRLLRMAGEQGSGGADRRVMGAMVLARKLADAGAVHLNRGALQALSNQYPPDLLSEYLAHEYLNAHWEPCFHSDVAADLAAAKLDYAASATVLENFPDLMMTPDQRAICAEADTPALRELAMDLCLSRGLRHDIYVRGRRRISDVDRDAALRDIHLTLTRRPDDFSYEVKLPIGSAGMERALFEPVVESLSQGPRRIGDLLSLPALGDRLQNPAELIGMFLGTGQVAIAARPDAGTGEAATRLNHQIALRVLGGETARGALASLRLGSGMPCADNDFIVTSLIGRFGEDARAEDWSAVPDLPPDPAARERLARAATERQRTQSPVWKHAGII
jgi:SAM-dependent methyltransferase